MANAMSNAMANYIITEAHCTRHEFIILFLLFVLSNQKCNFHEKTLIIVPSTRSPWSCTFQEQFSRCGQSFRYRKLLFSLAWFHAILLERRKFKSLGFNVPYEFNESDFSICHDLVIVFLDEVSLRLLPISRKSYRAELMSSRAS